MADRFPGYDVLAKRDSASWNAPTRRAIDDRLALTVPADAFTPTQLATLRRLVERICPEPSGRPATTTLTMVACKIAADGCDGFRHAQLPRTRACWLRGLHAIEAESREQYAMSFAALSDSAADTLLRAIERGEVRAAAWADLSPRLFWVYRLIPDLVGAHWAQPSMWSAMGFGGPASPRGYVRMDRNRRDPWEAIEQGESLEGLPRHHG